MENMGILAGDIMFWLKPLIETRKGLLSFNLRFQ